MIGKAPMRRQQGEIGRFIDIVQCFALRQLPAQSLDARDGLLAHLRGAPGNAIKHSVIKLAQAEQGIPAVGARVNHRIVLLQPLRRLLQRVSQRVREGGHGVPSHKVLERYPRSVDNLRRAVHMADLALRVDPAYEAISRRFHADPAAFADAFARAWFKLTHRDMGPRARYAGNKVPAQALIWQDPLPPVDHPLVDAADVAALKGQILASGLTVAELVRTAWASASTFRSSDKRGGANGARIRLAPQKDWEANRPQELAKVLAVLETVQRQFNGRAAGGKQVSRADLIVLGGIAALESAAAQGGMALTLPFTPGRSDATAEQTDAASFAVLEPQADALRNFAKPGFRSDAAQRMIDRAQLLGLSAPQLTALLGGLRALGISEGSLGVLTHRPGVLSTDFFRNLLDMGTQWSRSSAEPEVLEGRDRASGALRWTGSVVDLSFGSNAQLRALAEVYAAADGEAAFLRDFSAAWVRVMEADRFELRA